MPFTVFLITNPICVFVYLLIINAILKSAKADINKRLKFIIFVVIFVISFAINIKILFTDYRKSTVDASPIAELTSEQINRLEDVIETFYDYEFIRARDIEEKLNHPYLYKIFRFSYDEQKHESKNGVNVTISFFRDELEAIDSMQFNATEMEKNTFITNDNNTQAVLFHSQMDRSGELPFLPTFDRYMNSYIRLGNAQIRIKESIDFCRLNNEITSEFIEWLCGVLVEYE